MIRDNFSYWEKELYDITYDLIVVGGGLTGQSAAHFYTQDNPGQNVLVIDRGHFPIGASTRNAGFACIGTIGEHIADLEIDSEEQLRARIKNRYDGLNLLRDTLGDPAISYEDTGGWEIFTDSSEFEKAKSQIPKYNVWMEELIGEKDLYEAGSYLGIPAIYNRTEGMLHPGKMIKNLYHMNRNLGIEFRWNTPIERIDPDKNEVYVAGGVSFKAEKIIVATNAFTTQLLPEKKIRPGRGYVLVTSEYDGLEWKGTFHYNKGYVYFRNLGKNRILIGGGRNMDIEQEETTKFGINQKVKDYIVNFVNEVIEFPAGWTIAEEWSGIMGFTESKSPIMQKVGENCLVVAGLSGMGVALGMNLGKKAADSF